MFLYAVPNVCAQVQATILLPEFELAGFEIATGRFPCPALRQPATFVQPFCCPHEPLGSVLSQVALPGSCFRYWKPHSVVMLFCVHSHGSSLCSLGFTGNQGLDCTDTVVFIFSSTRLCVLGPSWKRLCSNSGRGGCGRLQSVHVWVYVQPLLHCYSVHISYVIGLRSVWNDGGHRAFGGEFAGPSATGHVEVDCGFGSNYVEVEAPPAFVSSATNGGSRARSISNTARSALGPSQSQTAAPHKVRGPNWTEPEMLVLIAQKRIEWDGRHNCSQPSLARFVYGTTAWKLVLAR